MTGPFCAQCGQAAVAPLPTLKELLSELIATLTNADSRLWRTLWALLFKPGQSSKAYVQGQRAHVLPPFRLYLIISLVFFMVLGLDNQRADQDQAVVVEIQQAEVADSATTTPGGIDCQQLDYSGFAEEHIRPRLISACEQAVADRGAFFSARFVNNIPTAMFILMPLFAGFMLLWYWRPRHLFVEHLIFQVFNHSGLFLMAAIVITISWAFPYQVGDYMTLGLLFWAVVYSYFSLKKHYGQGRWLTVWKLTSLGVVYGCLLTGLMVLNGLAAIW